MKTQLLFALALITFPLFSQDFDTQKFDDDELSSALFEDLDGDGILEIIGKSESFGAEGLYVWKRISVSPLEYEKIPVLTTGEKYFSSIGGGDLDNDGDFDIVISIGGISQSYIFENTSTAEEISFSQSSIEGTSSVKHYAVNDIDGDGNQDILLIHNNFDRISILYGNGDLTFAISELDNELQEITRAKFGDLNNDGNLDIIVGGKSGIYHYENTGDRNFTSSLIHDDLNAKIEDVEIADINSDGFLDVIFTSEFFAADETAAILVSDGNGDYEIFSIPDMDDANAIVSGDLNNDGKVDLIISQSSDNALLLTNIGENEITFEQSYFSNFNAIYDLIPGDADGDGDLDYLTVAPFSFGSYITLNNIQILNNEDLVLINSEIHPNPARETITISGEFENISEAAIYDYTGKLVMPIPNKIYNESKIDITTLSEGIYQFVGSVENGVISISFIKK